MGWRHGRAVQASVAFLAAAALASGCGDDDDSDDGSRSADNAVELSGRIEQKGAQFSGYGFVTRLESVDVSAMTSEGGTEISEKNALVTFVFDAQLSSRAVVGNSFSIASEGTLTFYLDDEPGASFDDPDSFAAGEEVAKGALRVTDVVTVYAPNSGIQTATGSLGLDDASSFDLGGTDASIGESGDEYRITVTGRGTRTDALIPESNFDFAGQLQLVD